MLEATSAKLSPLVVAEQATMVVRLPAVVDLHVAVLQLLPVVALQPQLLRVAVATLVVAVAAEQRVAESVVVVRLVAQPLLTVAFTFQTW